MEVAVAARPLQFIVCLHNLDCVFTDCVQDVEWMEGVDCGVGHGPREHFLSTQGSVEGGSRLTAGCHSKLHSSPQRLCTRLILHDSVGLDLRARNQDFSSALVDICITYDRFFLFHAVHSHAFL